MERFNGDFGKAGHSHFAIDIERMGEVWKTIGGKWRLKLIIALAQGDKRFNELKEAVHGISPRALSKELRELEKHGLIKRMESRSKPGAVSYQLTDIAFRLKDAIRALDHWNAWYKQQFRREKLVY